MFYAMAEGKIDLKGYRFEHILQDIQTLNERASCGELHITAVSIHALAYILDKYAPLPSGASMAHARGMDVPLADEFIGMYVNDYTLDYGDSGREAIRLFLGEATKKGLIPAVGEIEFVE